MERIKKGDRFKCIKNYFSRDGRMNYFSGKVYISDIDDCLTDDSGYISNVWVNDSEVFKKHFVKILTTKETSETKEDRVLHPSHYTWLKEKCGIEVIDITRHLSFDIGNAIKYLLRAGHKQEEGYTTKEKQIEDLKKAIFYINDELNQIENGNKTTN